MSIRTALIGSMLLVVLVGTALVAALGVWMINASVVREAQQRVNHDLRTLVIQYEQRLSLMAGQLRQAGEDFSPEAPNPSENLRQYRQRLGLTVLNACRADGTPLAGTYPDMEQPVPLSEDPVLRDALEGKSSWGTVRLEPARLRQEGGAALVSLAQVNMPEEGERTDALFWWAACPLFDASGRVQGLVYGGRILNHNHELVDQLREMVFTEALYEGKPVGTVTLFLEGTRVATNVLGPDRRRAVGTRVSKEVQRKVLEQGQRWTDRAWVVDSWYLSGYEPLENPNGRIVGMLYAGLLEAPYRALRMRLILRFLALLVPALLLTAGVAWLLARRLAAPVKHLSHAAGELGRGNWEHTIPDDASYGELEELTGAFREMQDAIEERDAHLTNQNQKLAETNEKLQKANRNYMEMLGFVTHELKSPLASIQTMIDLMVEGYSGDISEEASDFLLRIKRNCEELQDLVKNYLDLSRVERGELVAHKEPVDFHSEVVLPAVEQTKQLFDSRQVNLEVECPEQVRANADAELLRIALTNFLTNAAKYGREGGRAKLEVSTPDGAIEASVWNEGEGFEPREAENLFKKFSRLKNAATRDKKGSGVGLFLCKQILDLHCGQVHAEASPGQWAKFSFRFPRE